MSRPLPPESVRQLRHCQSAIVTANRAIDALHDASDALPPELSRRVINCLGRRTDHAQLIAGRIALEFLASIDSQSAE